MFKKATLHNIQLISSEDMAVKKLSQKAIFKKTGVLKMTIYNSEDTLNSNNCNFINKPY